ncbi:uncharacterized protein LOC127706811 [Mytilus californianus]|uniref:uncharacterized protein LOC127706811 n=1 Tax=Mytilus californianus TaxID=6549 RepID=UPI0022459E20|nr:uncharacterized protein LOC127706811 [Mytilus californianus]
MEQDLPNEEEFTQSCLDGDKVNIRVITSKIDENVETIMKNVKQIGEIVVVVKPTKAIIRERMKRQAQIIIPKIQTKSIDNITAQLQQTIKMTSKDVRGCCILPDGRMAFTCTERRKLILMKANGTKDFEMKLLGAYDVANGTKDNTVIVSSCLRKSGISIVDIQDRKIKKFIPDEYQCFGLVERNGNVIFCSGFLKMLNLHTETVRTIKTGNVSSFSYVDTNGKNIYYTNTSNSGHSVTCCDFQGVIKWTFKDENILKNTLRISVDEDGFAFVLSNNSVVLISPCGTKHWTLLLSSDGLNEAQALHYDKARDILLVA